jgi:hypothetical protein
MFPQPQVPFDQISALDFTISGTHAGALPTAEPFALLALELRTPPAIEVLTAKPTEGQGQPGDNSATLQRQPSAAAETLGAKGADMYAASSLPAGQSPASEMPSSPPKTPMRALIQKLSYRSQTDLSLFKLHTPRRRFSVSADTNPTDADEPLPETHPMEAVAEHAEEKSTCLGCNPMIQLDEPRLVFWLLHMYASLLAYPRQTRSYCQNKTLKKAFDAQRATHVN